MSPRSRKDNYTEALFRKLKEVVEIAFVNNVHWVVLTGDVFHKKEPSRVPYFLTSRLIDLFNHFHCPVFTALGNHDIQATPSNWLSQPIGVLVRAGAVNALWEQPVGIRINNWYIEMTSPLYTYDCDGPSRVNYYGVETKQQHYHIRVVHGMLLPPDMTFFGEFTRISDLVELLPGDGYSNLANLYLAGHYHDFLGEFWSTDASVKVVNPGALMRGSIDGFNLCRVPQVALITLTSGSVGIVSEVKFIKLKSVESADDVFYVEEFKKEKLKYAELEHLAEMLRDGGLTDQFRVIDPEEAMQVVFKSRNVKAIVKESVREFVRRSREQL